MNREIKVSVGRTGIVKLYEDAYQAMGCPRKVLLYQNPERHLLGIKPVGGVGFGYTVNAGRRSIAAQSVLRHLGFRAEQAGVYPLIHDTERDLWVLALEVKEAAA